MRRTGLRQGIPSTFARTVEAGATDDMLRRPQRSASHPGHGSRIITRGSHRIDRGLFGEERMGRLWMNLMDSFAVRLGFLSGVFLIQLACTAQTQPGSLVFAGSAVGREGEILRGQIASFEARHPGLHVEIRSVPDAADQQHQLYVQWLNAHATEPDVLQLDVIATPEFAAAGWILPLDSFHPATGEFFPAVIEANRWKG